MPQNYWSEWKDILKADGVVKITATYSGGHDEAYTDSVIFYDASGDTMPKEMSYYSFEPIEQTIMENCPGDSAGGVSMWGDVIMNLLTNKMTYNHTGHVPVSSIHETEGF